FGAAYQRVRLPKETKAVPYIHVARLKSAIRLLAGMSIGEKGGVCEEIFNQQPALLSSVLVLPHMGVAVKYVDAVLDALLVIHLALKASGTRLKAISEDEQENEMQRYVETAKFADRLDQNLVAESIKQYVGYRKEPMLMAYVVSVHKAAFSADFPDDFRVAFDRVAARDRSLTRFRRFLVRRKPC
ncbi:MAG: hypothetical protein ABL967_20455, partial [Bryobacteraceae bacterium]